MKLQYINEDREVKTGDSVILADISGVVMGIFPPNADRNGLVQISWPSINCTGNYAAETLGMRWFVPLPKWEAPVLRKFAPPVSAALTPVGMSEISQELDAAFEQIAELTMTLNRLSAILSGKP